MNYNKFSLKFLAAILWLLLWSVTVLTLATFVGGNFYEDFEFLGLRGYEATGILGLMLAPLIAMATFIPVNRKINTKYNSTLS